MRAEFDKHLIMYVLQTNILNLREESEKNKEDTLEILFKLNDHE